MSEPTVAKLRLSCPSDLVEAVPYLLGFHPQDSVVAVALRGARSRVVFTMRLDLPGDEEPAEEADDEALAGAVAAYLAHARADRAVVVTYSGPARGGITPHAGLIGLLTAALADRGIELTDAIHVGGGRWWSHLCANSACCPAEGTVVEVETCSAVAATATYAGLVALPSRRALEQTLEPAGPLVAERMRRALERADAEAVARGVDEASLGAARRESVDLLTAAVDDGQALSDDEVARLIVGLGDVTVRDACCTWATTLRADPARRLWATLASRSVAPWKSAPLFLVGWFAYLSGDATLAAIAIEHCLRHDPTYACAQLLNEALQRAVDPEVFRGGGLRPWCGERAAGRQDRGRGPRRGGLAGPDA